MTTPTHRRSWSGPAPRVVAGLISGTSADGIAACLVKITEKRSTLDVRQLAFVNRPYPGEMRKFILANSLPGTGSVDVVCTLNALIGVCFADAVVAVAKKARVPLSRIDLIGSHGQTVHHIPNPEPFFGMKVRSTLQIGDPSVIAQRTGITTVGDFRPADLAADGQGAPLVPYLDYLLFRLKSESRMLLNLGGIANFTVLPKRCTVDDVRGLDTGPANMVIDALSNLLYREPFDRNGLHAAAGKVVPELLAWMMSHPYFRQSLPKTTGREQFGSMFVEELLRRAGSAAPDDLLATATECTALSVYNQYVRYFRRSFPIDAVLVSGGGAHNLHLVRRLQAHFGPVPVRTMKHPGFSSDAKEAVLFAILARETVLGRTSNVPRVTGATRSVLLGKICVP